MLSTKMLGAGCVVVLFAARLVPAHPVNLEDRDLSDAVMPRQQWAHARLANADLARADLTASDLRGADLRKICLASACLRGSNLAHADLRRADLAGTDLTGTDLTGVNLDAAIYDHRTRWPAGFRVVGTGARCISVPRLRR